MQRLREVERDMNDARYRDELLMRNIDDSKRRVREARDSECNTRSKAVRGTNKDIEDLSKDLERYQDESGTDGAAFVHSKANIDWCRESNLKREPSKRNDTTLVQGQLSDRMIIL